MTSQKPYIEVRVRMSREDKERLCNLARTAGLTLSDYLRRAIEVKAQLDATVRNASEGVQ